MGRMPFIKSSRKATLLSKVWFLLVSFVVCGFPKESAHGLVPFGTGWGSTRLGRTLISNARVFPKIVEAASSSELTEPEETPNGLNYGRQAYWEESYKEYRRQPSTNATMVRGFSWYCGWEEELGPFFSELVPDQQSKILVPGVGNDMAIRDMFDGGYEQLYAFGE